MRPSEGAVYVTPSAVSGVLELAWTDAAGSGLDTTSPTVPTRCQPREVGTMEA